MSRGFHLMFINQYGERFYFRKLGIEHRGQRLIEETTDAPAKAHVFDTALEAAQVLILAANPASWTIVERTK